MVLTGYSLIPYRLPLRQPWRSAQGEWDVRQGWLVRLESRAGLAGFGDCAPLPMAGTESPEQALAMLARTGPNLQGLSVEDALEKLDEMTPAARCGMETALLDLLAQRAGLPLARWLNPVAPVAVKVNASLGAVDVKMAERALAAVAVGYEVLKLKVGLASVAEELALLGDLAGSLPPGVGLRLDANCAWDEATARTFLAGLAGLPVESVEDPLATPSSESWRKLQAGLPFPLAADESLLKMGEAIFHEAAPVRRVVVKPMVLGGLMPAWSLARRAAAAGRECVVTTTVDSAVGVFAALHLAAAVANDLAHGLATSSWLERDVGKPPQQSAGGMLLGNAPGLGCFPAA